MVKILEHGTKKTVRCACCGCNFMFDKIDTTTKNNRKYVDYFINCPDCHSLITVTSLFVPVVERR